MPVDRRLRDQLADVLAADMRHGADADELLAQVKRIHNELAAPAAELADQGALEIADEVIVPLECGMQNDLLDTAAAWGAQRRRLAFLLSESSLPPSRRRNPAAAVREPPRRLARVLLVLMLLSIAAWPWAGPYAFIACWIISPLIWLLVTNARNGRFESSWPFESESEWLRHEPLLAKLDLPTSWEASPHHPRAISRSWRSVTNAMTTALLFVAFYLFTASIWPLSVIVMSFMRDDHPRGDDAAAAAAADTPPEHAHVAH